MKQFTLKDVSQVVRTGHGSSPFYLLIDNQDVRCIYFTKYQSLHSIKAMLNDEAWHTGLTKFNDAIDLGDYDTLEELHQVVKFINTME